MQANPKKFQFMLLSSCNIDVGNMCLYVGDTLLYPEPCAKVLGVTIDRCLTFSNHVSNLCQEAAKQLHALARISRYLDEKSRIIIYNSFVKSNFDFCPLVWNFCGKVNSGKIEKVQERALRIIHQDYDATYSDLLQAANAPSLTVRRIRMLLYETFKSVCNVNSECLNDMFVKKETSYSLRKKVILIQPKRRTTTYGLRSVSYLGSKLWNDHPFVCLMYQILMTKPSDQLSIWLMKSLCLKMVFISFNWSKCITPFYVPHPCTYSLHCIYFCTQSFTSPWLMLSGFFNDFK